MYVWNFVWHVHKAKYIMYHTLSYIYFGVDTRTSVKSFVLLLYIHVKYIFILEG